MVFFSHEELKSGLLGSITGYEFKDEPGGVDMDVTLSGSALSGALSQSLSGSSLQNRPDAAPSGPAARSPQNDLGLLPAQSGDRLELTGSSLVYYASQEYSIQESGIRVRPDGTYSVRQWSVEARQEILISLNFSGGSAANVNLDAVRGQLEQIIEDLQRGFRDSIQSLVNSLRSTNSSSPSTRNQSPSSDILNGIFSDGDKRLISDYLAMIKQLAGDDSIVGRLAIRLEQMLGLGQSAATQDVPSGNSFQLQIEQVAVTQTKIEVNGELPIQEGEPLVLDLDGDGIELRSMEEGVEFDIDNDGKPERTGFVTGADALLALDKNGNRQIDGVRELFGDKTGAKNGFEDLARYDSNGDGVIDRNDPIYSKLLLFQDINGDGRSQAGELSSLASRGIVQLSLNPVANPMVVAGNRITETAEFIRSDGSKGMIAEAYFRYREV